MKDNFRRVIYSILITLAIFAAVAVLSYFILMWAYSSTTSFIIVMIGSLGVGFIAVFSWMIYELFFAE